MTVSGSLPQTESRLSGLSALIPGGEMGVRFPQWHHDFLAEIPSMSNRRLLAETIELANGDDYDGGMTRHGDIRFAALRAELDRRLAAWYAETPEADAHDDPA